MEINMEHYHCGWCGKYVAPDDAYYGRADLGKPVEVYCYIDCWEHVEGHLPESVD